MVRLFCLVLLWHQLSISISDIYLFCSISYVCQFCYPLADGLIWVSDLVSYLCYFQLFIFLVYMLYVSQFYFCAVYLSSTQLCFSFSICFSLIGYFKFCKILCLISSYLCNCDICLRYIVELSSSLRCWQTFQMIRI